MLDFVARTGLLSDAHPPRRYLWTDAHAVCNLLSLYRRTARDEYLQLARALIDQVHSTLGKYRADDPRSGWISGLAEQEGGQHPTAGGLRIGKPLPERRADEAFDEQLEWDRDGQYYHYLTKWMHALCRAATVCNEPQYCRWAFELARAAHAGFVARSPYAHQQCYAWKMNTDLTRPLVPSSNPHDSLDGFITYHEIAHCAARLAEPGTAIDLDAEISAAAAMLEGHHWQSNDPLGIGGLLFDAGRALQLIAAGQIGRTALAGELLGAAVASLHAYRRQASLELPARYRLAFRELGLATGLHAVGTLRAVLLNRPQLCTSSLDASLDALRDCEPLARRITDFWSRAVNQQDAGWKEHADINAVMLATSLLPDDYLEV